MKKLLAIFAATLVLGMLTPTVSAETDSYHYTAGPLGAPWIWCEAGGHEYVPIGDPDDYSSPDGWAFSGEPECLAGDVAFGDEAHGWGAIAIDVTDYLGGTLTVNVNDDNFDATSFYLYVPTTGDETASVWTCNAGTLPIPTDARPHWQDSEETFFAWADIDTAWADVDTLEPCFGSTGVLTSVVTAAA